MMMNGRVYLTSIVFALSVAVFVPRAAAEPIPITPVPVGVGPADDLIVSFYFAGLLDLPFISVSIDLGFSGWEADETITFDFFNDQVGLGGLNRSQTESGGVVNLTFITIDPNFVDGAFSVGMRLSSGSADLISATSTEDSTIPSVTVDGFLGSIPMIPEPGIAALVGLGLAMLAFVRRTRCIHSGDGLRRKHPHRVRLSLSRGQVGAHSGRNFVDSLDEEHLDLGQAYRKTAPSSWRLPREDRTTGTRSSDGLTPRAFAHAASRSAWVRPSW